MDVHPVLAPIETDVVARPGGWTPFQWHEQLRALETEMAIKLFRSDPDDDMRDPVQR